LGSVVPFKAKEAKVEVRATQVGSTSFDSEQFIEDFRGMLWNSYEECGMTLWALAAKANVSPRTILNFLFGITRRPQVPTIMKLLDAMGYRIGVFQKNAPKQKDEITLRNYRGRAKAHRKALVRFLPQQQ
jgi:hypothetical protein